MAPSAQLLPVGIALRFRTRLANMVGKLGLRLVSSNLLVPETP